MGQYYKAVTISEEETVVYSLQPKAGCYNGLKLTEHSWIGNHFTDFFSHLIHCNPFKVVWIGDYANNVDGSAAEKFNSELFEKAWGEDADEIDFENPTGEFDYTGKYLVNHSKKIFFKFPQEYSNEKLWCAYPVSLLTAMGNGIGGGDYHDAYPNADIVGSWALDLISIEDSSPAEYTEISAPFFSPEA